MLDSSTNAKLMEDENPLGYNSADELSGQHNRTPKLPANDAQNNHAALIAGLSVEPRVVSGRVLKALGQPELDMRALVICAAENLERLSSGGSQFVTDILGSQTLILQALVEHCAWRLSASTEKEGARVYGGLLLGAQRQLCQVVTSLQLELERQKATSDERTNSVDMHHDSKVD